MANVPITSLPEATSPSANDYLILQGESTQKIKWSALLDKLYPVGCIYQSASSTSPASFLGGTWERIKDTFILAAGDTYAAGSTGGEAQHALSQAELPNLHGEISMHSEDENKASNLYRMSGVFDKSEIWPNGAWEKSAIPEGTGAQSIKKIIFDAGANQSHNNMPPYLAAYIWRRIA